jgi:hypothetical protein
MIRIVATAVATRTCPVGVATNKTAGRWRADEGSRTPNLPITRVQVGVLEGCAGACS